MMSSMATYIEHGIYTSSILHNHTIINFTTNIHHTTQTHILHLVSNVHSVPLCQELNGHPITANHSLLLTFSGLLAVCRLTPTNKQTFLYTFNTTERKKLVYSYIFSTYLNSNRYLARAPKCVPFIEQIELLAMPLDYVLWSNTSYMNQRELQTFGECIL